MFFGTYGNIQGEDPDPKVNDFFVKFASRSGGPPPTSHALTGYSIVEGWAKAVNEAGTLDGDAVQKVLETFKDVPLLVGPTSFSPEYHVQTSSLDADHGHHRAQHDRVHQGAEAREGHPTAAMTE